MNEWHYQYIKEEQLHYITEIHSDDGVITEEFPNTLDDVYKFLNDNNITLTELSQGNLETERLRVKYVITKEELKSYTRSCNRSDISSHGDVDEY